MVQKILLEGGSFPGALAFPYVMADYVSRHVSYASKEFSRTPQVSIPKVFSQPRMLLEKLDCRSSLEKLKCLRNTHRMWNLDEQMDVVRHNLQLIDNEPVFLRDIAQKLLAMLPNNLKLEGILRILRLPHKVESILSNTVAVIPYSFLHFTHLRHGGELTLTLTGWLRAPAPPRTHHFNSHIEIFNGGKGYHWAKAQGILTM